VTFFGIKNRRVLVGWIGNWNYAPDVPTNPWRGAQSVPRELALIKNNDGSIILTQTLVQEFKELRGAAINPISTPVTVRAGQDINLSGLPDGRQAEIEVTFQIIEQTLSLDYVGFKVLQSKDATEYTLVGYNVTSHQVFIDRSKSGQTNFNPTFLQIPSVSPAIVLPTNNQLHMRILIDRSSVEVYVNDGSISLTTNVYPIQNEDCICVTAIGRSGYVDLIELKMYSLQSIWH
jgi:fructan beta-fructosidase